MSSPSVPGLTWLNSTAEAAVRTKLHEVCAAGAWSAALLAARPFPDVNRLLVASDAAVTALQPADLDEALAGHPQIGRPDPNDPKSAGEQRGIADAAEELRAEMRRLNLAYQEKFGHTFLVCAAGRSGEELRDAARERLANSPQQERETVRAELAKINRLRLQGLVGEEARA